MKTQPLKLVQLGAPACQVLQTEGSGQVSGISRRGIYLEPGETWTLFLTREPCPGPLTINVVDPGALFELIHPGSAFTVQSSQIIFLETGLTLTEIRPPGWKPDPPTGLRGNLASWLDRFASETLQVLSRDTCFPLLDGALTGRRTSVEGVPGLGKNWHQLLQAMSGGNPEEILASMTALLGLGPGLTPLGDDLLLGILLALNRWTGQLQIHFSPADLNRPLLKKARQQTTRLSSSLLACAIEGTADIRLINVLDDFFKQEWAVPEGLPALLDWGSSSGAAVLAGMLAVLRTY